jgi:glycosyltransferase involved in cell wall biosynthesis
MKDKSMIRQRVPDRPPVILPVPKSFRRPLWSVMIPVYNCAPFLKETLESVLSQNYTQAQMQIEVVDDCSTDVNVEELVAQLGKGRITYFRQPENVGSLRNFQTCIERSRGYLIHILHGDDKVRDGFYRRFEILFKNHQQIGAAFCRYAYINEEGTVMYSHEQEMEKEGVLSNWLARLGERQRIQYCSIVVKRAVYENLGSFYGVEYGEDWEMWVRVASQYSMGYIPDVLAEYRKHFSSISGRSFLTGKNMRELATVMHKIQEYLPEPKRQEIISNSKKFYAHYALRVANDIWCKLKNKQGASAQAKAAWEMNPDLPLLYKIIKLYTRMTLNL